MFSYHIYERRERYKKWIKENIQDINELYLIFKENLKKYNLSYKYNISFNKFCQFIYIKTYNV